MGEVYLSVFVTSCCRADDAKGTTPNCVHFEPFCLLSQSSPSDLGTSDTLHGRLGTSSDYIVLA